MNTIIFATRPSKLARWQTQYVINALQAVWPDLVGREVVITTQGDEVLDKPLPEIGGKGLFTQELEQELLAGRVQAAVHSLKDLPVEDSPGLTVGLIPKREDAGDVLVSAWGFTLDTLPEGATVGTSSLRRQAQLLASRPDLTVKPIRGNVDTRIRKVLGGAYDAAVMARAGVKRLGLEEHISEHIPLSRMLPAPGQGALGVQCREDDAATIGFFNAIADHDTRQAVTAERAFLAALGGGCSIPVGAYASVDGETIYMQGVVAAANGSRVIRVEGQGEDPLRLGQELAQSALDQGAEEVLGVSLAC